MKKITLLGLMLAGTTLAIAQKKAPATAKPAQTATTAKPARTTKTKDGFIHTETGLEYKVIKHGTGKKHPGVGDRMEMNIHVMKNDSTIFESRAMNGGKPVPFQVQQPTFKGDPIEGFMQLVEGDSALLRLPVDSLLAQHKQVMPGMKAGDMLNYRVTVVSVKTEAEYKKEQEENAAKQVKIDEAAIKDYLAKNNITNAKKTASGLYYSIEQPGTGENASAGKTVMVNYTGMLLNGKKFDSNTDPEFKHTQTFPVVLGTGGVIKGWEEGLALLNKGAKATFYIPSGLAYGSQDRSPQIPANSVLVFKIEIVDIATQKEIDDKAIQDYLQKNKIKANKTASGLYYSISKEGTGPKAQSGNKVSVNYTGMTLDGRKFDSNVDSAFKHVSPFEFDLGKGMVIKGWDEGIGLLNEGTKATLFIPSDMAYGRGGQPPVIPPNAVLMFEVELVNANKK